MKFWIFQLSLAVGLATALLSQPVITRNPTNQTASVFANATFRVTATGDAPLLFQWRFNDSDLAGKTNLSLSITNVQRANVGNYSVVVSNPSGSVTSQVATLTITPFNSIYEFGFSWTDTHNCAQGWTSPDYYNGRASNGPLWPEYLSTNLGMAYVEANNYARCGATSSDVRDQVNNATSPQKPALSLFYVWAGDGEFFRAIPPDGNGRGYLPVTNEVAWSKVIQTGILNNSNAVARLYSRGARNIVVSAGENGTTSPATTGGWALLSAAELRLELEHELRFYNGVYQAIAEFARTRPDARILLVDIMFVFDEAVQNPSGFGFTRSDISALDDRSLTDKSFNGPGADYLFWDGGHPTTKFHNTIAARYLQALTNFSPETLEAKVIAGSPRIEMNHLQIGRDYTLQRSTEFKTWIDIESFTASAGTNQWSVTGSDAGASYFRLKWEQ